MVGIVGVVITAALVAVVATRTGQGDASPKGTYAAIFGIIAVYVVILFVFQSRDLSRAEGADAAALAPAAGPIENPATMPEPELWAAMAIEPIDAEAARAREQIWSTTRSSMRTGMLVTLLIFLTVPPAYLLGSFVPILIGAPLIVLVALAKGLPLLAGRGLDRAYEDVSRAMAPLGLAVTERPELTIEPKYVDPVRFGPALHGALMLEGKRHGRVVVVRMPAGGVRSTSYVGVGVNSDAALEFKSRDGRISALDGSPAGVVAALRRVRGSTRWNGVRGEVGQRRIAIERKGSATGDWLMDLWLAERLADALER